MNKYYLELKRANVVIGSGGEVTNAVWGAITGDIKQQTDLQKELTSIKESIPEPYNDTEIKEDITTLQSIKADKSDIPDTSTLATKEELNNKANISDVYSKTEVDQKIDEAIVGGEIDLSNYYTKSETYSKSEVDGMIPDISGLATKTELSSGLDSKADKADTYTKSEIDGKNYLTSETDPTVPSWAKAETKPSYTADEVGAIPTGGLKTINGQTLEGDGNIVIDSPEGGISDSPLDGKLYGRKDGSWAEVVIPTVDVTKEYVDSALESKLDKSVYESEKANFVTNTTLEEYATKDELNNKLDSATYNSEKTGFATKSEISDMLTKTEASSTYQIKGDYALKNEIPDTSNLASKSELPTKTSDLTNDSGYITSIPEEYVTETELESKGYAVNSIVSSIYATKEELNQKVGDIDTILDNINGEVV